MLFSNRNEFLRDSSRIEPIASNIRNDIVSESGMTRSSSRLEKKVMKPHESPRIRKKINSWRFGRFVACMEQGYYK